MYNDKSVDLRTTLERTEHAWLSNICLVYFLKGFIYESLYSVVNSGGGSTLCGREIAEKTSRTDKTSRKAKDALYFFLAFLTSVTSLLFHDLSSTLQECDLKSYSLVFLSPKRRHTVLNSTYQNTIMFWWSSATLSIVDYIVMNKENDSKSEGMVFF